MDKKKLGTECSSVDIITAILVFLIIAITVIAIAPFAKKFVSDETQKNKCALTADQITKK